MGYVFLLIASLAGISKVVAMKSSGRVCPGEYNSVRINAFRAAICLAVSAVIFAVGGANAEWDGSWIWLLSGVSNAIMMFAWVLCAERMGLVFVEAFCMVGSVAIPLFLAPLLFGGETVSIPQWAGVLCLLIALYFLFAKKKEKAPADGAEESDAARGTADAVDARKKNLWIAGLYILLLILSNAGMSITQKLYPLRIGKEYTAFFNLMTFAVVFLCFAAVLIFEKAVHGKSILPENASSGKKLAVLISIAAVMIYIYSYFATLAAGELPSAVYYPLTRGVGMLLTVLCDTLIFKQKLTKNIFIGLIFIFASILLTNLSF